jgi:hypothetical protein
LAYKIKQKDTFFGWQILLTTGPANDNITCKKNCPHILIMDMDIKDGTGSPISEANQMI